MQLTIRGQESYLLDFNGDETFAELKNRVCEQEKTEVLLYVSGKPLPEEGVVSSIENCAVDVTVPLLGGKVILPKYLLLNNRSNFRQIILSIIKLMESILNDRFTVPWLVLAKSVVKHQKLMHKKRRKSEQVFILF